MNILENQVLEIENLISFRGKISNFEMNAMSAEMKNEIEKFGAVIIGEPITATFEVNTQGLDVEILLPINKKIECNGRFVYKEKLKIINAVKASYIGNASGLDDACNILNEYIREKRLRPITVGYNVLRDMSNINEIKVDIYVGIDPNIL